MPKSKKRKTELSDEELARLANQYEEINRTIKKLEGKKAQRKKLIIEEMERRGTKALERDDVRVSVVRNSQTSYDLDALQQRLTKKQFSAVTRPELDKDRLGAAVQEGVVKLEEVEACASVSYSNPYIRVSLKDT